MNTNTQYVDGDIAGGHLLHHHLPIYGAIKPYKARKSLNKQKSCLPTFQIP